MTASDRLTLGIEEEYQIVDAEGRLRAHIDMLMAEAEPRLGELVKPEFLQSEVEVGTKICADVAEARREVTRLRATLAELLEPAGLRLASAGTNPISHWHDQKITEDDRYKILEEEMQDVARELLIFGLHVHIGIPDPDLRIEIVNEARYFLPHILALSTSSPFWLGRNTGLKSYRCMVWSRFPRTGIPIDFPSHDEWLRYVDILIKTNSIDNGKKIWWDLRPHYLYPTIEFRICDAASRIDETICIAALIQALVAKLIKLRQQNLGFRKYPPALIAENKWRAARRGVQGSLIDWGKQREVAMRDLAEEWLDFIDDVVDDLGSRQECEYIRTIVSEGTSADRQLAVYERTGDLSAVVDSVCAETVAGI
jgi:carboxylate-amine ligase